MPATRNAGHSTATIRWLRGIRFSAAIEPGRFKALFPMGVASGIAGPPRGGFFEP